MSTSAMKIMTNIMTGTKNKKAPLFQGELFICAFINVDFQICGLSDVVASMTYLVYSAVIVDALVPSPYNYIVALY